MDNIRPKAVITKPLADKKTPKKFIWRWWEILIVVLLLFLIGETIYFYCFATVAKRKIFKPQTSSANLVANIGTPKNTLSASTGTYKDYTTFLFMGIGGDGHPGGSLTDSIQVVALNNKTNELKIISVPRDLYLKLDNCGMGKINEMYQCGEGLWGSGGGGDFSKSIISQVLGMPINYYVEMNFNGFIDLVNALGGIDIQNTETINNDPNTGLNIIPGNYHMDGDFALQYARSRETTSDFDRSGRQQKIMLALQKKIMSSQIYLNPIKVYKILDILANSLTTDLSNDNALSFLKKAASFKDTGAYVIDNSKDNLLYSTTSDIGSYILLPVKGDFSAIAAKVKQIIINQ